MNLSKFAKGFGESLASGPVGRSFMPGPLELFQQEQRGKLTRFLGDKAVVGSSSSPGLMDSYFSGRNMTMSKGEIGFSETSERLAKHRKRGAMIGGGLLAANTLGLNPFGATSGANNLATLGMHATVGSTMYGMGGGARMAGMGYMAAGAFNTFRSGNNPGPM